MILGSIIGLIKGDARSLDYRSCRLLGFKGVSFRLKRLRYVSRVHVDF